MATSIEHLTSFSARADSVYSAQVDPAFLQDRLKAVGGPQTELLGQQLSEGGVTVRLRQGVPAGQLPSAVRTFLSGDLVVARKEIWRGVGDGEFEGRLRATIPGVPGEITARTLVADLVEGGCEWVTTAQIRVGIPLLGAKVENLLAEQVRKLMAAETEFTGTWLASRKS
jgi:hypothetical protein